MAAGTGASSLLEFAGAKINLNLRVRRRRADGYHELESLVVFADIGDRLRLAPAPNLSLFVEGPTAAAAGPLADNLVIKAARALLERNSGISIGAFQLNKQLPAAAGIGGGSADAAAALRLLARLNLGKIEAEQLIAAARAVGADVPVCLDPQPRLMRGIGEILSAPLSLRQLPALLVNPGVAVPTGPVFAALAEQRGERDPSDFIDPVSSLVERDPMPSADALLTALAGSSNDLEEPAIRLAPIIADALVRLRQMPGCRLARMSGSGATCFGLFENKASAADAERKLQADQPKWWIKATLLNAR